MKEKFWCEEVITGGLLCYERCARRLRLNSQSMYDNTHTQSEERLVEEAEMLRLRKKRYMYIFGNRHRRKRRVALALLV